MPNLVTTIRCALSLLAPAAFYTVWITSQQKGLRDYWFQALRTGELAQSPDAKLLESFTGLRAIDVGLKALVVSFWPVCNGENPSLSLLALPFAATAGASYILLALEARRTKSAVAVAWRLAWFGVLQAFYSQALLLPIYCAFTLSPGQNVVRNLKSHRRATFCSIPGLKTCLLVGYYMCIPMLALPSPSLVTHRAKQVLLVSMVVWTLWVFPMLWVASRINGAGESGPRPEKDRRSIYIFALGTTAIAHGTALVHPLLCRTRSDGCGDDLSPTNVFLPPLPWSIGRFSSLEEGVASFLQWDYLITNVTLLLWATAVYLRDCGEEIRGFRVALQTLVLSTLASPAGAAVALIWRLDWNLSRQAKME
ncbi:hypothetical protein BDW71DRAFT_204614 [Aspergillus fruticulosus]